MLSGSRWTVYPVSPTAAWLNGMLQKSVESLSVHNTWFRVELIDCFLHQQNRRIAEDIYLEVYNFFANLRDSSQICEVYPRTIYIKKDTDFFVDVEIYCKFEVGDPIPDDPKKLLSKLPTIPEVMDLSAKHLPDVRIYPWVTVVFDDSQISQNQFDDDRFSRYLDVVKGTTQLSGV